MPIALTITRDDYTAAELREAATCSNDADATRRMLALALVLEGYKRGEAGKLCGMDRQTLRDWVLRYTSTRFYVSRRDPNDSLHKCCGKK
jgi:Homeodomain-like domain